MSPEIALACPERRDRHRLTDIGIPDAAPPPPVRGCEWSVTVIARNEAANLPGSLESIAGACAGRDVLVSILVNGSRDDTAGQAVEAARKLGLKAIVYAIQYPDKSNAWNQFIHALRPSAERYFFVDAHVRIAPDSLTRLCAFLDRNPGVNAVSGSPIGSRSSAAWRNNLLKHGGITGNLHLLSNGLIDRITEQGFFLPTGLYRGDGLLNSFAAHDGDALNNPWKPSLAVALPDANFYPLTWKWRSREMLRHWERRIRQGQGRLENEAVKWTIYSRNYSGLPALVSALIHDWIAHDERRAPSIQRDPFAYLAWRRLSQARLPSLEELRANLVHALCD
jgi:glycosyltransferase involved in cell wall biosynthesis